jgi:hypothetical protein
VPLRELLGRARSDEVKARIPSMHKLEVFAKARALLFIEPHAERARIRLQRFVKLLAW